jgi:hypothetical protein
MKMTNWITGKLNLLNGDNTSKEAVSQHYGTTSAPAQPGSNPVANAYGASQPKADGTHEPNVFDTFHDWWNGTSDAKDEQLRAEHQRRLFSCFYVETVQQRQLSQPVRRSCSL